MATTTRLEVRNGDPVAAIQGFLKRLLAEGLVGAVLVPRRAGGGEAVMPSLVADPRELDQADPLAPAFPLSAATLAARLTHGEPEKMVAAVLRPCEIRAFVELVKLNQGSLDGVLLIGVDCLGAYGNKDYRALAQGRDGPELTREFLAREANGGQPPDGPALSRACRVCEHPSPEGADLRIELFGQDVFSAVPVSAVTPRGEGIVSRMGLPDSGESPGRGEALAEVVALRTALRDAMFAQTAEATGSLSKLAAYLSGCVNCYNCRVACPVCYCRECVFLTDVFDHKPWQYLGWARHGGAIKMPTDTVFFHLTRLAHMSTACVGCGQCSNACPNEVPVMELFRLVASGTQAAFDYQAGRSASEAPPLTVFQEKEFAEVTGGAD
jgi:formate dehydrogenase subunit beta